MLSVHTNFASLVAQNSVNNSNSMLSNAIERLSTGLRINSAADDAAGLQIATRMEANITGMKAAQRNISDSTSMLQTADGALAELTNITNRQKELATQALNGVNSDADRVALDAEYQALSKEAGRIIKETTYAGNNLFETLRETSATEATAMTKADKDRFDAEVKVFTDRDTTLKAINTAATAAGVATGEASTHADYIAAVKAHYAGTAFADKAAVDKAIAENDAEKGKVKAAETITESKAVTFQIGAAVSETLDVGLARLDTNGLKATSLLDRASAEKALEANSSFSAEVGAARSKLGAGINRLGHTAANLANVIQNTTAAAGRIMDADFASESAAMTKNQMLVQAGTNVLAKSNQNTGLVMGLLR